MTKNDGKITLGGSPGRNSADRKASFKAILSSRKYGYTDTLSIIEKAKGQNEK